MERSKAGMKKKEVPTAHHYLIKHSNSKHNIVVFEEMEKVQRNSINNKTRCTWTNEKWKQNHPPSPLHNLDISKQDSEYKIKRVYNIKITYIQKILDN